ncbi:MAG: type II secretion system protein N [Planctomycetota bacterium]
MNLTQLRRTIFASAGALVLTTAGTVVWSLGSIEADSAVASTNDRPTKSALSELTDDPPATKDDDVRLNQRLQQTLYDPPKKPKTEPVKPQRPVNETPVVRPPKPPRLDWTLIGTIIDSGNSIAIIADASGKTDIRTLGEEVDLAPPGVLVRKIDSQAVTLEVRGKESTLRLKQDFSASAGGAPKRPRRNNR